MFDCSKDVVSYHNDEVTLPQSDRSNMRKRRNSNRDRLKKGLTDKGDPQPFMLCKQGSYAMLTMVQHDDNHYDIDDGVYFEETDLDGKNGGKMLALDARKMVRDAVDDGSFKTAPIVKITVFGSSTRPATTSTCPCTAAVSKRTSSEVTSMSTKSQVQSGGALTPASLRIGLMLRTTSKVPTKITDGSSAESRV